MNRSLKVTGVTVLAVFALCAVAVASASANTPRYKVAKAYLGSGVTETINGSSSSAKLAAPKLGLNLNSTGCTTTGKIVGSAAGSPGTNKEITLTCVGVTVEGAATCKVHSPGQAAGTVKTNLLSSELVWLASTGNAAGDRFFPTTAGGAFVEIIIESCAAAGTYPVKGESIGQVLPVATEATTGSLVFPTTAVTKYWTGDEPNRVEHTSGGLTLGGQAATFSSTFSVSLASGKAFGVFQ